MDTVPIRTFHLRGRTVQLLAGILCVLVGTRIYGQDAWKGVFVLIGSLPVLLTPILLRSVEVAEGWLRVCLRIGYFVVPYKDSSDQDYWVLFQRQVALRLRTYVYPLWALPFGWAMSPRGIGILLSPIFLVESAAPRKMSRGEIVSCLLLVGILFLLTTHKLQLEFQDLRVSDRVLALNVMPPNSDYLCIIGPYRNHLLRDEALELDHAQWREAASFLEKFYYDDDSVRGVVLIARRGKLRTEKLRWAAGRGVELAWQEAKYNDYIEQVCVRNPYYQMHEVDSRKLFRLLARKPY